MPQTFSRRNFLKGTAVGAAGAMPAPLQASLKTHDDLLETCIADLRQLLAKMHPQVTENRPHYLSTRQDGSYRLSIQGDVSFATFDGDGLYEISMDGYLMTYWLERDCHRSVKTGLPIPGMEFYRATQWHDGQPLDDVRKFHSPNIVRKL